MKTIGIILVVSGILFATTRGAFHYYVSKQYTNEIGSKWELSDRASTIVQKAEYLDKFICALEKNNLNGVHNTIFYPNDENDFTENMRAIKSLQKRLHDIETMDENSFAYQTAMQQITAQEQGEAHNILNVLQGCWEKQNYYTTWNDFIVCGFLILQILMIGVGCVMIIED